MTARQLFEAIGHVDDDLILAADAPARRKRGRVRYLPQLVSVAACACVFAVGLRVWTGGALRQADTTVPETAAAQEQPDEAAEGGSLLGSGSPADDAAAYDENGDTTAQDEALGEAVTGTADLRAVMVDGVLYYETGETLSVTCGTADGVIDSSVDADALPTENDQSNFGTGYSYQFWDDDALAVEIDGAWILFQAE